MAAGFGGKRYAIGAVVIVLLGAVWLFSGGDEPPARDGKKPAAARTSAKGRAGWLPWLSRLGGSEEVPDPYKGPRVPVRVKVVDVHGNPVAGVRVEARVDPDEWEYAGLTDEEYESHLARKQREEEEASGRAEEPFTPGDEWADGGGGDEWRVTRTPVASGRTDREGLFVAKLKPDVDVVFHARDGDGREGVSPLVYVYLVRAPDDGEEEELFPGSDPFRRGDAFEVTIELAPLGILAGVVVDDRGLPIADAEVTVSPWSGDLGHDELVADESGNLHYTQDDGSFRIPLRVSGAFDVEVHAKKFQPAVEQAVQVLPGRETSLSITLLPSAELAGIVLDPRGNPVPDARVSVQGQPSPHEYFGTETTTDAAGRFTLEELAPGKYVVAASAAGFRPAEQWDVSTSGGELTLRLTAGGTIRGEVFAARDLAVRPNAAGSSAHHAEVHGGGDEWVGGEPPVSLFFGDVYVAQTGPAPKPGDPIPVGMPLATGVPAGREVESPSGTVDVRGRYVAQLSLDESGRGSFDLRGLPPGTYDVTVMIGPAVARRTSIRVWEGGTAAVSMELPDRGAASIAGTIRTSDGRPLREATVFLYGALPSGLSAWADESGRFEFRSVPPGEYMVHAAATTVSKLDPDGLVSAYVPMMDLTVPAGGRVPLELVALPADIPDDPTAYIDITSPHLDGEETIALDPDLEEEEESGELWMPDVWIEEIDGGLVVTWAPPGPDGKRLFGGDRVTSIDGAAVGTMESWEALDLLYGPKGSLCQIAVERPATSESLGVTLPRVKHAHEMESRIY